MLRQYNFWQGRTRYSTGDFLEETVNTLTNNSWTSPLYVDGARWHQPASQNEWPTDPQHGCWATAVRLLQALAMNTSATNLFFHNVRMDQDLDCALSHAMATNCSLRTITLRNLSMDNDSYSLPESVFSNTNLQSLTLSKVSISGNACHGLSRLIREDKSNSNLQTLSLDAVQVDENSWMSIMAGIVLSKSLKTLKLNNMMLTKEQIRRLLLAVSFNRSITNFALESMQLDAKDAQHLAAFLKRNKTVKKFSLRKNLLNGEAIQILVDDGILHNTTLESFYLSRNCLGDEGANHIATLLMQNRTLKELCLVDTKLEVSGSSTILKALQSNTSLSSIGMDGNAIKTNDVLEMLEQHNTTLTHVVDQMAFLVTRKGGDHETWRKVDFWLRANASNRGSVLKSLSTHTLQRKQLPQILANTAQQPDIMFLMLNNTGSSWSTNGNSYDHSLQNRNKSKKFGGEIRRTMTMSTRKMQASSASQRNACPAA